MPLLWQSLRTEAPGREIQIIITARQFHYLGEGYVALAHIGCLPCVKGKRRRGGMGAKAGPLWPWKLVGGHYYPTLSWRPHFLHLRYTTSNPLHRQLTELKQLHGHFAAGNGVVF